MRRFPVFDDPAYSWVSRNRICGVQEKYLFGRTHYLPGGRFGPRLQEAWQLVILIRGALRVSVGQTEYEMEPGDALLQRPGGREFYRFSENDESEHTWCQVWPRGLSRQDRTLLGDVAGVHRVSSSVAVLIEEGLAWPNPHNPALDPALEALARACLLSHAGHAAAGNVPHEPLHPAFERARGFAAREFTRLRSAQELARHAGISPTQLRLLFRQAGGESPSEMIWRLKAEHAVQLIRSTGLTLGEIADQCGYANAFHLSRSVKKLTGHAPRELRRLEWGGG